MPHDLGELRQKQSLPLPAKVTMSKNRIREWYEAFDGNVCVAFSGGKDSTVLLHLVRSLYPDVPAVFSDTGLEYPEVRVFALKQENVVRVRPEMDFKTVILKYGYPVISKDVARTVHYAKMNSDWALKKLRGVNADGTYSRWRSTHYKKWEPLKDAPFPIHDYCCKVIKKHALFKYQRETGRMPYVGMMAEESAQRQQAWMRTGCNAFEGVHKKSAPLSFWTEQDVLQYILENHLEIASIYGEIVKGENGKLSTTGADRTGCMFCMFGAHLDKRPNRFERMKQTHPQIYEYCMRPVENGGLGLDAVLTYLNIPH